MGKPSHHTNCTYSSTHTTICTVHSPSVLINGVPRTTMVSVSNFSGCIIICICKDRCRSVQHLFNSSSCCTSRSSERTDSAFGICSQSHEARPSKGPPFPALALQIFEHSPVSTTPHNRCCHWCHHTHCSACTLSQCHGGHAGVVV